MNNIIFLYGAETFRSHEKLVALKTRYVDKSLGDTNLADLDGVGLNYEEWMRQVQALPFLANSRLVIVRNLLTQGKKDTVEAVEKKLDKIPESTVVVFYESGQPDKRTKLFKKLAELKNSQNFEMLAGGSLEKWIKDQAAKSNLVLTPAGMRVVLKVASEQSNLWPTYQLIEQLATYSSWNNKALSEEEIAQFVTTSQAADVFKLIEAVAKKDGHRALEELETIVLQGEAELYVYSMIIYQFRTIILIAEACRESRGSSGDIARMLKMSPFAVSKSLEIAKKLPLEDWVEKYARLLEYDLALKTGEYEPRIGLETIIGELCS